MTDDTLGPVPTPENNVPSAPEQPAKAARGYADLYGMYATDPKAETDGIKMQFGEGTFITLARAGGSNKAYQKAAERFARPHRQAIERGIIDPKVADGILHETYAEAVVLGWEGVLDPKTVRKDPDTGEITGDELPFTRENVIYLFRALPELFEDVKDKASNAANFRAGDIADDLGN